MKIAVMQPYLFPYLGYFQLVNAVNTFVFYDDVNFINKGWINRNRILVNGNASLFTVPLIKSSQNKQINQVELAIDSKWISQFFRTIEYSYKKAPQYDKVKEMLSLILNQEYGNIAELAIKSVTLVSNYLELTTEFKESSKVFSETKELNKEDRLIRICQLESIVDYVNPIGGEELYQKLYFKEQGVNLSFLSSELVVYKQFNNNFISGLSIIDVLMFNSIEEIRLMLNNYNLK